MKTASPLEYAFSVGKIRALEKFLITEEVFEEALDASLPEALRLIVESDLYGEGLLHVKDSDGLEKALAVETAKLKKLVRGLLVDKGLEDFLDIASLEGVSLEMSHYHNEFLSDYLKHVADMHNIKTFLRLSATGEPARELDRRISCGGFLPLGFFRALYGKDTEVFITKLEYVHVGNRLMDYASYLRDGIKKATEEKSFILLERSIQDLLIHILRPAKYLAFGPEAVIAYYYGKINEINLVRMICLAKLNSLDRAFVAERMNSVYA